jgi:hypothetical protein
MYIQNNVKECADILHDIQSNVLFLRKENSPQGFIIH